MKETTLLRLLSIFLLLCTVTIGERLRDQISIRLDSGKYDCFTLLNGTHQVGCQSSAQGNAGTLILINHAHDIGNRNSESDGDIIVAVNIEHLTHELVDSLVSSDFIKGVILFQNHTKLERKNSEDSNCPNEEFSFYRNYDRFQEWNKGAVHPSGLRFLNWQKPVFYITNSTEIDLIINNCIKHFNFGSSKNTPKCTAKMSMRMHAAGDAQICLRRQQLFSGLTDTMSLCDPLGDENVFAVVPPISKNDEPKIIMISTRLDTFSMFTNNDGGDVSVLTSLIAYLTTANVIGKHINEFQTKAKLTKKQLMMGFFHGESLGYIGSSRMVYDMNLNKFPVEEKGFPSEKSAHLIGLKDLDLYLELQQVGFEAELKNYYVHYDPKTYEKFMQKIDKAVKASQDGMTSQGFRLSRASTNSTAQVPPSSYHTLLKHESVPGLIISTANRGFHYKDINSVLDKALRLDYDRVHRASVVQHINAAATSTLYAVLSQVLEIDPTKEKSYAVDQTYVEKLVDCFFYSENWNCAFFNEILNITQKPDFTKTLYIGTKRDPSFIRILVHALLIHSLGNKTFASNVNNSASCKSLNEGQNLFSFNWQYDPVTQKAYCYRTSIYRTPAVSPAFEIEDYDFASGNYSTWVESVWEPRHLELYITTGYANDLLVLTFGLILFVTSLLACRKMNIEAWLDDPITLPNRPEPL